MTLASLSRRIDTTVARSGVRRTAHRAGAVVSHIIDSAAIAGLAWVFVTFLLSGQSLARMAALWGDFLTHFAEATPAARTPVVIAVATSWLLTTLITSWIRLGRLRQAMTAAEGV